VIASQSLIVPNQEMVDLSVSLIDLITLKSALMVKSILIGEKTSMNTIFVY